jgi:polar amino acid transport system permease protein
MVYPAQIFLFVGFVYLMLCGALQGLAHVVLSPAMHRRKARL